jgi:TRAP-type C4-dicarboxylate transport system substrate-binding protein
VRFSLAVALSAALGSAANAEPIPLKFAFPAPPQSLVHVWGSQPWMEEVQKSAAGTIEIKFYPGPALGNFHNIYDRMLNGVADIAFGTFSDMAGVFPRTTVSNLPFQAQSCYDAGLALWRILENGTIAPEYEKVRTLALFTFPPSGFHSNKPLKTAADFKGMKLTSNSRVGSRVVELLGASPVTVTPPEVYPSLQRGLAQGAVIGWSAFFPFKLHEVTKYHLEAPFGNSASFFFMNKDVYAKLPEQAQRAFDRHSGEVFAKTLGRASDRMQADGRAGVEKMPGHVVTTVSDAEAERWKHILSPMVDEWLRDVPDGARVLAAYREEIAKIRSTQ